MKTIEESRVGARSLARNTFEGRGACWSSGMGLRRMTSTYSLTRTCTKPNNKHLFTHTNMHKTKQQALIHSHEHAQNQTTSWLVHCWSTFGARTNHGQTQTHKTHHGPDLGEATTFPLIVYFVPFHEAHIQMAFCPMTPKWGSRNPQNWDSYDFAGPQFCVQTSDWDEV